MRVETILKESCNFQKAAEVIGEHNFLPTLIFAYGRDIRKRPAEI